jgi:hypothetical protein
MSQVVHRGDVVDYGYGEMAARRKQLLAAASPALRARMLGSSPSYASVKTAHWITVDIAKGERTIERDANATPGIAEVLRREVRSLERSRDSLRAEIEALRQEQETMLSEDREESRLGAITRCFLVELERAGYRIDGDVATLAHLTSKRSAADWSRPRMVAMWLCWSIALEATLPQLGEYFCRDYTTIIQARRKVDRVLANVPALRTAALATCAALEVEPPAALQAPVEG